MAKRSAALNYVALRMEYWSAWRKDANAVPGELGITILGRLIEVGKYGMFCNATGKPDKDSPDEEEVDLILHKLAGTHPHICRVLIVNYSMWDAVEVKVSALNGNREYRKFLSKLFKGFDNMGGRFPKLTERMFRDYLRIGLGLVCNSLTSTRH